MTQTEDPRLTFEKDYLRRGDPRKVPVEVAFDPATNWALDPAQSSSGPLSQRSFKARTSDKDQKNETTNHNKNINIGQKNKNSNARSPPIPNKPEARYCIHLAQRFPKKPRFEQKLWFSGAY